MLSAIEGYFLSGYGVGGEAAGKELSLVPGAVDEAEAFLQSHAEVRTRFSRVADLVEGFETPFGLELLSTVHWVMTREGARTPEEVSRAVYTWSDRKKQFTRRQIALASTVLSQQGWTKPA